MVSESRSNMFVTAYYSILDRETGALTYASAGHNLALYMPQDGAAQPITTAGVPLGVVAAAEIGQARLHLAAGDVVLFFTDGLTEAINAAGEAFGEVRLAETLQRCRTCPAGEIADALETALQEFTGDNAQPDDFTLIVVKRDEHVD